MVRKVPRDVQVGKGAWGPFTSSAQERYARYACKRLAYSDDPAEHTDRWGFVKRLLGRLFPLNCYKNREDGLRVVFKHDEQRVLVVSAADRKYVYENENAAFAAHRLRGKK